MRFPIRYRPQDLLDAWSLHLAGTGQSRRWVWLAAVLGLSVLVQVWTGGDVLRHVILLAVMTVVYLWLWRRARTELAAQLQGAAAGDFTMELTEEGLTLAGSQLRATFEWSALQGWVEGPRSLLIYQTRDQYLTLPLSAVPPELLPELRELLNRRLPAGRPQAPAGPAPPPASGSPPRFSFQFQLAPEEVAEGFRLSLSDGADRRTLLLVAAIALAVSGALVGPILAAGDPALVSANMMLLGVAVAFVLVPLSMRRQLWESYVQMVAPERERRVDVLDEGLLIRSTGREGLYEWRNFLRWDRGETVLMLHLGPRAFFLVPWRAITPVQQTELLALLRKHVTAGRAPDPGVVR